ncbi:phosphodiesterase [Edwardsiella ictaluri]|uniref:Phosphoesterase n=2 Tax=Edwardsiella ictaluri TaxID=67780 RepID=C5B8L4_EDWI9|nr:phosphodiesterase [Edwardsiella ictaluri]ACR69875.1 phosphodiesterase, MJ0936 family [Edwardsiella ictaluri 93-146]EKS7761941.1 phosphodiesterase [Edwardsiella ictaluri]EKS7768751.1 phosphodiesterase [Edwardsiella ictaluri]EKS7774352.1 phosphodiesterase [Edwardsiella ictaluri]EKS7777391.1 phosphodiesterase [Edwardsiella ictaluri]
MKLMFISDIHGSLSATERALEIFAHSGCRWLILLGDVLNHGPRNPLPDRYDPPGVAALLNGYAERIIAVRGNCDSEVDQMLLMFPMMAPWQQALLPDRRFFLTHGHRYHPQQLPALASDDVLVYGHTHLPLAGRQGTHICFNPGSISLPKGGNVPSFGMLAGDRLWVQALYGTEILAEVSLSAAATW